MNTSTKSSRPILFVGGHHNSSLVIATSLKKDNYLVTWLGHKFAPGHKALSAEYQEVTAAQIPFYEFKTGKFYRKRNPLELLKIGLGFFQAFIYLLRIRPRLIVSFGGYLAVPVVIVGWLLHIPSVTHEQTVTAGWANKAVAPFVKQIFLTHKSSLPNYPKNKSVVTGLPIQSDLLHLLKPKKTPLKTIFITCGKQGSHIINQALFPIIPQLLQRYRLIHQTGTQTLTADQEKARRLKASLPRQLRNRYHHQPYFFGKDAIKYLHSAHLIISRAGAHTVYELLLLNKRNITIPIPWVSHNEQLENAKLLAKHTATIILREKDLTPDTLLAAINQVSRLKPPTRNSPPVITDATQRILTRLKTYLD